MAENAQNRYSSTAASGDQRYDPYQLLQNVQLTAKAAIEANKQKLRCEKERVEKEIADVEAPGPVYENQRVDVNTNELLYNIGRKADMQQSATINVNPELWELTDQLQAAKDTCSLHRQKMRSLEEGIFKWNVFADKEDEAAAGMLPSKNGDLAAKSTIHIEVEEFSDTED